MANKKKTDKTITNTLDLHSAILIRILGQLEKAGLNHRDEYESLKNGLLDCFPCDKKL